MVFTALRPGGSSHTPRTSNSAPLLKPLPELDELAGTPPPPPARPLLVPIHRTLLTPPQVAAQLVSGIERGCYHLPTPDLGTRLLLDEMAGISPKHLPAPLGFLLAPITYLATAFLRGRADAAARKHNATRATARPK